MRYQFKNGDLDKDIEKINTYDEVIIDKDVIDNEGESSYILDVNDTGYSYVNKEDRDKDFDHLLKAHLNNELQNYKRRGDAEELHPVAPESGGS